MALSSVKVTVNGQEYTLTLNTSTGKYEGTITAPSQSSGSNNSGSGPGIGSAASGKGYYPITVTATDDHGNVTAKDASDSSLGTSLRLKVLEKTVPTAAVTYPTAGATITNSIPSIAFKFTDSGSGINPSSCYIKVDSGSWTKVTVSGSGTTYTGTYTPSSALSDGSHSIQVKTTDYDGNEGTSTAVSFKVDTAPPALSISSPLTGAKLNTRSINLVGSTSDVTSSPVTVSATLNGADVGTISVASDGSFSKTLTGIEGTNTIIVTATDSAGQKSTQTVTVSIDVTPPVISGVTVTPNPSSTGATVTISVTVTDA